MAVPMRVRVTTGARALYEVLKNPDDTSQVFRLLSAVNGGPSPAFLDRFAASRGGQALLARRPELIEVLEDRARLEAMPEGSVGRGYLTFMENGGYEAAFLVRSSEAGREMEGAVEGEALAWLDRRMRDSHDLWHVVTGYGADLLGEAALLAFTFAQTWNAGVGVLVSTAILRADDPDARRLIVDGFARGARAAWLPAVAWEELLPLPLEEVRARLRVGAPVAYEPFFAKDLPPGGLWAKPQPIAA